MASQNHGSISKEAAGALVSPDADSSSSVLLSDTVGNKADTAVHAATDTDSLVAYIKAILLGRSPAVFWSDVQPSLAIPAVAADLTLPSVTIPSGGIPSGVTILSVYAVMKWGKKVESSGSANAINGVGKTARIKKSTGAWGTDDLVAVDFPDNTLATAASSTESGDIFLGNNDVKAEVDAVGTYNFRSEQTNRTDALVVDGASLTLYDVQTGLIVRWK